MKSHVFKILLILVILGGFVLTGYAQAQEQPLEGAEGFKSKTGSILSSIGSFFSNIFGKTWNGIKKVFNAVKEKIFSKDWTQKWLNERKQAILEGLEEEKTEISEAAKISVKKGAAQVWGSVKNFLESLLELKNETKTRP